MEARGEGHFLVTCNSPEIASRQTDDSPAAILITWPP